MSKEIDKNDFTLVSPLGGTFRYYIEGKKFFRKALDTRAHFTQADDVKPISRSVYEFAYRRATKTDGVSR